MPLRRLWTSLSYPERAWKLEAVDPARVAPTYVEAVYEVGATTGCASRSIGVRVEYRGGANDAARLTASAQAIVRLRGFGFRLGGTNDGASHHCAL
jgi:hypothetical protein